jgi:hypothetical protein
MFVVVSAIILLIFLMIGGCEIDAAEITREKSIQIPLTLKITSFVPIPLVAGINKKNQTIIKVFLKGRNNI